MIETICTVGACILIPVLLFGSITYTVIWGSGEMDKMLSDARSRR